MKVMKLSLHLPTICRLQILQRTGPQDRTIFRAKWTDANTQVTAPTLDERATSAAQERYLKGPDSGRSSRTVVGSVGSSTDYEKFSSDHTVSDVHHNETLQSGINHAATVFRRSYKEKVDRIIKQGLRDKKRRRRHVLSLVRQLRALTIRIKLLNEGKHAVKERAIEQENSSPSRALSNLWRLGRIRRMICKLPWWRRIVLDRNPTRKTTQSETLRANMPCPLRRARADQDVKNSDLRMRTASCNRT